MSKKLMTPRAIRREQERKEKKLAGKNPQESGSIIATGYSEVHKMSYAQMLKEVEEFKIKREKDKQEKNKQKENKEQENKQEINSAADTLKHQYQVFIQEMVDHGQQRKAYMAAYPDCSPHSADTGAGRLMEKPGIRKLIEMGRAAVNEQRQKLRQADAARQIADLQQKHETLKAIYNHEWHKKQTITKGNDTYIIKVTEDPMVRLHAMKEDAKVCAELSKALEALAAFPEWAEERILEKEQEKLNNTQHAEPGLIGSMDKPIEISGEKLNIAQHAEPGLIGLMDEPGKISSEKLNNTQHASTMLNIPPPSSRTSDCKERVKDLPANEIRLNDFASDTANINITPLRQQISPFTPCSRSVRYDGDGGGIIG